MNVIKLGKSVDKIPLNVYSLMLKTCKMAKSQYDYVRSFESDDKCLQNCWIIVRIDGRNFCKFSTVHNFFKPNDETALQLMNHSACCVMNEFNDIFLAYGQSDEFSFIFDKNSSLFNRRASKLMTTVCSLFSCSYVFSWKIFFNHELIYPPSFDARVILYPSFLNVRDYLSWRQVDCHINNLYNTTFWMLVKRGGLTPREAEEKLRHTDSSDKNEILFSQFNTNYNNEPKIFKKGSVLIRKISCNEQSKITREIETLHCDIIKNEFWEKYFKKINYTEYTS